MNNQTLAKSRGKPLLHEIFSGINIFRMAMIRRKNAGERSIPEKYRKRVKLDFSHLAY